MRLLVTGILIAGVLFMSASSEAQHHEVTSPDGLKALHVQMSDGEPKISVVVNGAEIIHPSPLGFVLPDGAEIGPDLTIGMVRRSQSDTTWTPVYGTEKTIRDHYNAMAVQFDSTGDHPPITLHARAYNDGVAFRYEVAAEDGIETRIANERTAFDLAADPKAFALVTDNVQTAYENGYVIQPMSQFDSKLIGYPLLLEFPDGPWIALTEAALTDYAGQFLTPHEGEATLLHTKLSPPIHNKDQQEAAVVRTGPFVTPWRVVMIGERPGDLIESNLILNLNEPCALEDTAWIKPGKAAWDWWSSHMVTGVNFEPTYNTELYLYYADLAHHFGFEYLLIDDGWAVRKGHETSILVPNERFDVKRVVEYCNARGVDVLLWMTWDQANREMEKAFPLYEEWGIAGVKIDFMNSEDQFMVEFYHRATKLAAKHQLLVNFHGAYKPTGFRRTYPNLITREGVKGEEHSKWSRDVTPNHNVTIPFTRMLAGPMDYTPGGFSNRLPEQFETGGPAPRVMGTRANTLAKFVVYESPLQMVVDYPHNYYGEAGADFLEVVPTTWDHTKVLDGYPGEFISILRQHGEDWYIGIMNGEGDPREITMPLDFLQEGAWKIKVWQDGPRAHEVATQLTVYEKEVTGGDTITFNVINSGGAVARIVPADRVTAGPTLLRHHVGIQWKEGTSEADRKRVCDALWALSEKIPLIIDAERGPDSSGRNLARGYGDFVVFTFRDQAAMDEYLQHPIHDEFVELANPHVVEFQVMDWVVERKMW